MTNCCPEPINKQDPCWDGYVQRGMKPGDNGRMVPNCIPVTKMDAPIVEGDFVIAMTTEGPVVGQVEHVMLEGGTYGQPGNPYSVESTSDNPAVAVRMLEEEDGTYYYTPYSIGALMSDINRINMPNISLEDYEDKEKMSKAEGYSPPAGARSAARRAIKFKEDGKANGAGTAVGWTRAGQLARGESLSLSTVKRMFSYFSRHEVDKKGKDWGNNAKPSHGYVMWLAWGGDAGFSWSRSIVNKEKDKALFADFFSYKSDTPMDVSYNATVTDPTPANPSSSINPAVGMKKPQYMMNFGRQVGGGIHDKRVVDIWTVKADTQQEIIPAFDDTAYDGCDCEACMVLNVNCKTCPVCSGEIEMSDKSDAPMPENSIMPAQTYQGCTCGTLGQDNDVECPIHGTDAETEMAQKRNFNSKERQQMASTGAAMPDGSFPIANAQDLASAIRLYGHAKNPDAAKTHIKRRAAALGLTASLPDDWKNSSKAYDANERILDNSNSEIKQEPVQESFFNFRDLRPTRNNVRLGE